MLTLQHVKVRTGSLDSFGGLVFDDGSLVALLVRLDDPIHCEQVGHWNLETSMDVLPQIAKPFDTLDDALCWIDDNLRPDHRA